MVEEARPWPHRRLRVVREEPAAPVACLMELAGKLAGEPWTDYPECVHPTLGAVARGVYAHSSDEAKPALVPLAPALLDTARTGLDVSARLVATCVSTALASPLPERIDAGRSRRLEAARRTACYLMAGDGGGSHRGGEDTPRVVTRMWVNLLSPFGYTERVYRRVVSPAAAALAVAAIAEASGDARDERLSQLLRWCIDLTRRLTVERSEEIRGEPRSSED